MTNPLRNTYVLLFLSFILLAEAWFPNLSAGQNVRDLDTDQDFVSDSILINEEEREISVNMPKVEVSDALRILGQSANMNLVIDKDVSGVVDLLLQKVPFREAWESLLQTAGLDVQQQGGVTRVFPKAEEPEPVKTTVTRLIRLKHITLGSPTLSGRSQTSRGGGTTGRDTAYTESGGTSAAGLFQTSVERGEEEEKTSIDEIIKTTFGEEEIRVAKDTRTNQLILTGPSEKVDAAERLVAELDRPVAQVLIQAKIIRVSAQALDQLGIDWGGVYTVNSGASFNFRNQRQRTDPGNTLFGLNSRDLNYSGNLVEFDVTLAALLDQGEGEILFSPRVVTQDNMEAFIASGQEIQVPAGLDINGNAAFRERQANLELGVTPRVLGNGLITLVIRVRNDRINYEQPEISGVPPLDITSVESFVTLRDSDTVVIGGILSSEESRTTTRLPLLSDIPLVGRTFTHTRNRKEQTELIILISPTVISDESGAPVPGAHPGTRPSPRQQRVMDRLSAPPPFPESTERQSDWKAESRER